MAIEKMVVILKKQVISIILSRIALIGDKKVEYRKNIY